ncbi:MAG: class I SAM-dependent methyltransferase [Angelakisella sp.]
MDKRLTLIKDMVRPCGTVADIGTDHGYLVCALVAEGIAKRGIAADINPMPLDKARRQIDTEGLAGQIDTVLTDGLSCITLGDGDGVAIAGMGGELIARILADWQYTKTASIDYYLQPMTKPEKLRDYLYRTGFAIVAERCCVAAGRPYSVIHARYCGRPATPTPAECFLGQIDPQAGEAEAAYCRKLQARLGRKLAGLTASGTESHEAESLRAIIGEIARRTGHESC